MASQLLPCRRASPDVFWSGSALALGTCAPKKLPTLLHPSSAFIRQWMNSTGRRMGKTIYANGQALCFFLKSKINILLDLKKRKRPWILTIQWLFRRRLQEMPRSVIGDGDILFPLCRNWLMRPFKQSCRPTGKGSEHFSVHLKFSETLTFIERKSFPLPATPAAIPCSSLYTQTDFFFFTSGKLKAAGELWFQESTGYNSLLNFFWIHTPPTPNTNLTLLR